MVMNEATDIAFYSVDSQLRAHLHRRMEILENSIGQRVREKRLLFIIIIIILLLLLLLLLLLQEEEEDLRGLLTTFFAPLTTSFVRNTVSI